MKFLTNTKETSAARVIADVQEIHPERRYVIGPPQATEIYSVAELERFGMVGLYEVVDFIVPA